MLRPFIILPPDPMWHEGLYGACEDHKPKTYNIISLRGHSWISGTPSYIADSWEGFFATIPDTWMEASEISIPIVLAWYRQNKDKADLSGGLNFVFLPSLSKEGHRGNTPIFTHLKTHSCEPKTFSKQNLSVYKSVGRNLNQSLLNKIYYPIQLLKNNLLKKSPTYEKEFYQNTDSLSVISSVFHFSN